MNNQARIILKEVFGYDEFRTYQDEIIKNVLNRKDTLAIIPTGGGKSICYQIPALIFEGLSIVISPLISLMKDQTDQLTELGVSSVFLNSSLSYNSYKENEEKILNGKAKLLYVAPEALLSDKILKLLMKLKVECITVDEAHCISEWGHDFRPKYRRIVKIRDIFKDVPILALTATATKRVQKDIVKSLQFKNSSQFVASFNRENLFLDVIPKINPARQTIEFLEKFPDKSGIIYCFSRNQVDDLSELLLDKGFSVKPYHAGLNEQTRKKNQELFINDDVKIVVATIAFGMGINKPNIRFVIHFDLPKSIESYYQEIGRAGRDGLQAHCLLLFGYGDIQKIQYFINKKADLKDRNNAKMHLDALLQFAETEDCKRIILLNYFGETYIEENCGMCTNCISDVKEHINISLEAKKFLSCVKRTGEVFGAGYVIDVLRGSESQKVLKNRHNKLSTYGIGKEHSKKQWFHFSRRFLQNGLLTKSQEYGSLKLTDKAWDVFKDKEIVLGTLQDEKTDYSRAKTIDLKYDETLFNKLRNIRKALATQHKIPPFVIFPDKSLVEMAALFPKSEESLLTIHGVGRVKFIKFGEYFLNVINNYCDENNIQEVSKFSGRSKKSHYKTNKKYRHHEIGEQFNSGSTIEELAEQYNIKEQTISNHLYKYLLDGNTLSSEKLLDDIYIGGEKLKLSLRAFDECGIISLKPVFDFLEEAFTYEELSIIRLYYMSTNPT